MPNKLQKSLKDYLSKIKKPATTTPRLHLSSHVTSPANWILGGCKHPKTLSFAHVDVGDNPQGQTHANLEVGKNAATLSDIDQFLIENFKSLYLGDGELHGDEGEEIDFSKESDQISPPPEVLCPWKDIRQSHRFFVDSGSSGSQVEEARTSATMSWEDGGSSSATSSECYRASKAEAGDEKEEEEEMGTEEFIAVFTYSLSPQDEFRRSMMEMVEARVRHQGKVVGWQFMEELLFCYLNLNDNQSYKYILNAFVDLIIGLRVNPDKAMLG